MNTTATLRRLLTTAATVVAAGALTFTSAPAANADPGDVGDASYDAQGYAYTRYGVTCTVTAGQPVVVTINGARTLQSTETLACNGAVNVTGIYSELGTSNAIVAKVSGAVYGVTQASVVMRATCRNAINYSHASYTRWSLDFNRDGIREAIVQDLSNWNLRSCGL